MIKKKIAILKVINSYKLNICASKTWELCEYFLPQSTTHFRNVKTFNKLEKPRYIIIRCHRDRKNSTKKLLANFYQYNIKNLKVYINSEVFPYEDFQCDFTKNKIVTLYRAYAEFKKSYCGRDNVTPSLNRFNFKKSTLILVIDMSRQNDNIKTSTVDLRVEFEASFSFAESTSPYCLILHDQIVTYNPFNSEVRIMLMYSFLYNL